MWTAPEIPVNATASFTYSGGMRGVGQTITVMRRMVEDYKTDPDVRQAAVSVIYNTPAKDERSEAAALFDYVRAHVRYVRDIHGVETIATPDHTLQARAGDCDDMALLLATLYESVGYPTRFVVAGYDQPGAVSHVYLQVFVNGAWCDVDPTERLAFGQAPDGAISLYYESV